MEQQLFYTQLNTAKLQFGKLRNEINATIQENNGVHKRILCNEIVGIIDTLAASRTFFKVIGKVHEVDLFIIAYQSLQARLSSA